MFGPFENATGITVDALSDGESQLAKLKLQVTSGKGNIDIIHGDASWLFRGQIEGLLAPMDYQLINTSEIYDDVIEEYGMGILYWSFNIVYNTETFPTQHPSTWAEVWEYAINNPRQVAMWSARPNYVIEAALMARGYNIDSVYPLTEQKIDEAFSALDDIKDQVIWYDTGSQGSKLFSDGEVVLGMFYGGDTFALSDNGIPVEVEWNEGIYTRDYWLVAANAPNRDNAMAFIEYVSQASVQAEFAEATSYGPINQRAFDLIDNDILLNRLPSFPSNKEKQLSYDYEWWGNNDQTMLDRWNNWLRQ